MTSSNVLAQVLFEEKSANNGYKIAMATLNVPKSLNALNLSMIKLLHKQLTAWLTDPEIAVIMLMGSGEKAFCAGGDVVSLYHDIIKQRSKQPNKPVSDEQAQQYLAVEFFTQEYQLDLLIHQAKKPILAWANGYVMGGGIGLMAGASHRVVTEKTLMAMPEVTIGLYPDVGASWFLNQMPQGIGLFLGLTGMTFNAQDALYIGLADCFIDSKNKAGVIAQLLAVNWHKNEETNQQLLSSLLDTMSVDDKQLECATLLSQWPLIKTVTATDDINTIYKAIVDAESDSNWFQKAQQKIIHGSPLSLHLINQQLMRCKGLSLQTCFERELSLSLRCCQHGEFVEGVRALLVDKDKQPRWKYCDVNSVDNNEVDWFFTSVSK